MHIPPHPTPSPPVLVLGPFTWLCCSRPRCGSSTPGSVVLGALSIVPPCAPIRLLPVHCPAAVSRCASSRCPSQLRLPSLHHQRHLHAGHALVGRATTGHHSMPVFPHYGGAEGSCCSGPCDRAHAREHAWPRAWQHVAAISMHELRMRWAATPSLLQPPCRAAPGRCGWTVHHRPGRQGCHRRFCGTPTGLDHLAVAGEGLRGSRHPLIY